MIEATTQRRAIGLDLGGTQVRAALVEAGRVLGRAAEPTDVGGGPEAVLAQLLRLAETACGDAGLAGAAAVGFCAPGPLDTEAGIVEAIPTLPGWRGFPIRVRLAALFGRPAIVENDGIAAAQGEWLHGAGRGCRNLVYVTVSTGIGGGVVVDGRLLHGRKGMAGHIGHMHMQPDGPLCPCGGRGCFEALASGSALGRRAREIVARGGGGYLGDPARSGPVEARHVVEGARAGDAACMALMAEEAALLGAGFANLAHLFSPERIIVGGGVARAFDLLAPGIRARLDAEAMPAFRAIPIVPAALGDDCGLIGAATLALQGA